MNMFRKKNKVKDDDFIASLPAENGTSFKGYQSSRETEALTLNEPPDRGYCEANSEYVSAVAKATAPAMRNAMTTPGPAYLAAATPVVTNIPAAPYKCVFGTHSWL